MNKFIYHKAYFARESSILHKLIVSFLSYRISHPSLFLSFWMDFGGPYLQHFSYRQALNSDIGPIGCYCPLPFNPDFGHSKSKMNTEHVMMLTNN